MHFEGCIAPRYPRISVRHRIYGVIFWLTFCLANGGGAQDSGFVPLVIPYPGVPASADRVWDVCESQNGLTLAAHDGIAIQKNGTWTFVRTKELKQTTSVLEDSGNFIIGGMGGYALYSEGKLTTYPFPGLIRFIDRVPEGYLLSGSGGILLWSKIHDGPALEVTHSPSRHFVYVPHWIQGKLYFTNRQKPLLLWEHGKLSETPVSGDLAALDPRYGAQGKGGEHYFLCPDGIYSVQTRRLEVQFDPNSKHVFTGFAVTDQTFIVADYSIGLSGYSRRTGKLLWALSQKECGGSVNMLRAVSGGAVIASTTSVSFIPDVDTYTRRSLGGEDLVSLASSPRGPVMVVGSGTYLIGTGEKISNDAMAYTNIDGVDFFGGYGHTGCEVSFAGKQIEIPGNNRLTLVQAGKGFLGAVTQQGVFRYDMEGRLVNSFSPPNLNILGSAISKTGELLLGTFDGAIRLSPTLEHLGRILHGTIEVFQTPGRAWLVNVSGDVSDEQGRLVGRIPNGTFLDLTGDGDRPIVLVRLADGQIVVGRFSPRWEPLQVFGINGDFGKIFFDDDSLYVVSAKEVIRVKYPHAYMAPKFTVTSDAEDVPAGWRLRKGKSDVMIGIQDHHRPGELAPRYRYALGRETYHPFDDSGEAILPRLPWGMSQIYVQMDFAGYVTTRSFTIDRPYPIWLSMPMLGAYGLALALCGYGLVRWRTRLLVAQTSALEKVVAERTKELVKAKNARELFISAMSHEIRNPLNGVVGMCDILRETASSAREQYLTQTLQGCADQLRSLLDDILDWVKIERGEIDLHPEVFEVSGTVEVACRTIDPNLSSVRLTLPDAFWLSGDVVKIRQIVINLVGNALKHGDPQVATVIVSAARNGTSAALEISVRNPGPRLSEEELSRAFEGFVQGEEARRRRVGGLGLGLAISRQLARAMGGDIKGRQQDQELEFCFTVTLPVAAEPEAAPATTSPRRLGRVLGVEDEPYNRLVLGHILEQLGFHVDWAVDGQAALKLASAGRYDLILTDYLLPDMTGAELTEALRNRSSSPLPPIVAVTAYSTQEKIAEGRAAGIHSFVSKPVSRAKIAQMLSQFQFRPSESHEPDCPSEDGGDFSRILTLNNGAALLANYAEEIPSAWASCKPFDGPDAASLVHALRSKILLAHDELLAEQLSLLETACRTGELDTAQRIAHIVDRELDRFVASAAKAAIPFKGE